METEKIYGWYSDSSLYGILNDGFDCSRSYYKDINGNTVAVTHITYNPNDSMTNFEDIIFIGELKKFLYSEYE